MSFFDAILNAGDLVLGRGWFELPSWYAEPLCKGAGHKYIKRVPKAGGGYRYFYHVGHGGTVTAEGHMVVGASFRGSDGGKAGHFHIVSVDGDALRVRHDETGTEKTIGRKELAGRLAREHAPALAAHADRIRADWKSANDNGASAKQRARIEARAKVAGVDVKTAATPSDDRFDDDALPRGFAGFKRQTAPREVNPDNEVRSQLRREMAGSPQTIDISRLVESSALSHLASPEADYWPRSGWSVQVKATDEASAQREGHRIQKKLVAKKNVPYSDPHLHQLPMFVRYQGGWTKIDGIAPKERTAPTESQIGQKDALKRRAEAFFGSGSIRITGKGGDYALTINPKLKEHKAFRASTIRGSTVEELGQHLQTAIQKIEDHTAGKR